MITVPSDVRAITISRVSVAPFTAHGYRPRLFAREKYLSLLSDSPRSIFGYSLSVNKG